MQRFFLKKVEPKGVFERDVCHQILNVLRMQTGDQVILLDNTGIEYIAELLIKKKEVTYSVLTSHQNGNEPSIKVVLYQALLKSQDRFEWSAQKATELGVTCIIPLVTERCQVRELKRKDRVEKIMKEASEQCERAIIPALTEPQTLESIFNNPPQGSVIFCCESLRSEPMNIPTLENEVHIIVGPEGGFTEDELAQIYTFCDTHPDSHTVSLGKRILRSETASIAMLSCILTQY